MNVSNNHVFVKLEVFGRVCFFSVLFLSLAHSLVYPILESPILDTVECSDKTTESEDESESEKESTNDDLYVIGYSDGYGNLKKKVTLDGDLRYFSFAYIDISTPPPEIV